MPGTCRLTSILAGPAATAVRPPEAFPRRVAKIGQQTEVQVVIPIGQKANFQRLDQVTRCFETL
jgi:hypothetical protein